MRILLVGASKIAYRYLARAIQQHRFFKLAGVVSKREERRALFEKEFDTPSFQTLEDAFRTCSFDGAYVSLPNSEHTRMCYFLLQEGKHVLIEKPCTWKSQELYELIYTSL